MSEIIPPTAHKKQCNDCHLWLPAANFSLDNGASDGLFYQCKSCKARHRKQQYNAEKVRARRLKNTYGITLKQYNQMFEEQGGVCAVCHQPESHCRNNFTLRTDVVRFLSVDHDHETGDVRALLCSACNVALGRLNEDPERIRALADYAEWCKNRHPSVKIVQLKLLA